MTAGSGASVPGEIWIDAQLPPALATWLTEWGMRARHVAELGFLTSADVQIFEAARAVSAIVMTKDEDFVRLLEAHGPPPQVVWVTIGNVRNARLRSVFERHWPGIRDQLAALEPLVELAASTP